MDKTENKGRNVSVRSFLTAIVVIFLLMVLCYILTFLIPGKGLPFWKWALSPFLVVGAEGGGTLIAVIAFLLVIGGIFTALDRCGLMRYMLDKTAHKFGAVRYKLMAVITFLFMATGAMIGSFEECVPLVPIVVALSLSLGWDALTGMGMSLLAVGYGFASGVCNPFTVGVAQQLAGLPMFSGVWLRLLSFVLIYCILLGFLRFYAKKIQKPLSTMESSFTADPKMDRALGWFLWVLGIGICLVLSSGFITALQDYTMIIVAVMFLAAGIISTLVSGMSGKALGNACLDGIISIFPAVLMILMAASIRYTLEESGSLDTLLQGAVTLAQGLPGWVVVLFIYLLVLIMNFFIPSGSAKAFMLIPLIVPLGELFGISAQLCVLAFAFGDGFSNVFYPTNPALLIGLSLADVNYGKWFKWSGPFQLINLVLTALILLLGYWVGY